jgi:hypothetical protein
VLVMSFAFDECLGDEHVVGGSIAFVFRFRCLRDRTWQTQRARAITSEVMWARWADPGFDAVTNPAKALAVVG